MLKILLLFSLVLVLLPTTTHAQDMPLNACYWLFQEPVLRAEPSAQRVLETLGLKSGAVSYGLRDRELVIPFFPRKKTAQAQALQEFLRRWDGFKIHYTLEAPQEAEINGIRIDITTTGQPPTLFIPYTLLMNAEILQQHLENSSRFLEKMTLLADEGVDFRVADFNSLRFHLEIDHIPETTTVPVLRWMKNRNVRRNLRFIFANENTNEHIADGANGAAIGDQLVLSFRMLLDGTPESIGTLAHEIVHGKHTQQFQNGRNAGKLIYYYAGEANTRGLLGDDDHPYNDYFRSDEVEAWSMHERIEQTAPEHSMVHSFLNNQIEWLSDLKTALPALENEPSWVPDLFTSREDNRGIYLYPGTEKEILIMIPLRHERIAEIGEMAYLQDVVSTRLQQLIQLRRAREQRWLRQIREREESEESYIGWWLRRLTRTSTTEPF